MRTADYPEVPPDFGHWLAGFIDGEGCFVIVYSTHPSRGTHKSVRPCCKVKLRDDDRPVLEEIVSRTGIGRLVAHQPSPSDPAGSKPQVSWDVHTKAGCQRLVQILDRFPLRSKKARDYAIWREAVFLWALVRQAGRGQPHDWTALEGLRLQLRLGRVYEPVAVDDAEPDPGDPRLFAD